ncbi:MAG: DsbA family protein [Candidatus Bipolaricaulota bacterium]|nr:DsbA family protein [Candidatus Bipolaricaulota bacterium]
MSKKAAKPTAQKPWYLQSPVLLGVGVAVVFVILIVAANLFFTKPKERAIGQDFNAEMGDPNAPVVVYEYSDFQCPACSYFHREHKTALEEKHIKTGNVRFIYRNFIVKGEKSYLAGEAAYCAAEQGAFWAYHDTLFEQHDRGVDFNKANLVRFARNLGLKEEEFKKCLDERKYAQKVREDMEEGVQRGINATPSFYVHGTLVRGADYLGLLAAIQQNLPPSRR